MYYSTWMNEITISALCDFILCYITMRSLMTYSASVTWEGSEVS